MNTVITMLLLIVKKLCGSTSTWSLDLRIQPDGLDDHQGLWSCWIEFDLDRCLELQRWVMLHCFVQVSDHVWQQVTNIPMEFWCSPQWCNLYFVLYEIKFIQRLSQLQQHHLLPLFRFTYCYIDDLCVLNNPRIAQFLDPTAHCDPTGPTLYGYIHSIS